MIKALFFDLSGVLYEGEQVIPGALATVNRLEKGGLTLRFVTNTSRKPRMQVLADLKRMGFTIEPEQLYTAPAAALAYCQAHHLSPYCLVHPSIKDEFRSIEKAPYNAVVLGDAAEDFTYRNLDQAFNILIEGGMLIAVGSNRYFRDEHGLHLDAGPFVKALEYAAGVNAIITGKPSEAFFQQVIASTSFQPGEILMVGDDVIGDIDGARRCGLETCLVQTGKYRTGDENALTPPAAIAADVSAAIAHRLPML